MALRFEILGRFNRARAAQLTLPHFVCQTPLFMPVGTQGTIKGLATNQLEEIGCQIILGNTYHLALRPTSELIDELGGLHQFMNWPRALLTDSGGFQMVSLLHLADITEKGVTFQSPVDGKPMLLTPEESIQIQNRIGADIIMALDDVVKTTITGPRIEEAMYRTLRWIDRCIAAHQRPHEQNLFGIVQGGLDPVLRDICVRGLVDRNLPGYAIGGLAGGESKDSFWRVVAQCTAALPEDKPRYVMGVGYPLDIVVCSALGADMYDCVYPTRTARFGTALVPEGVLKLKHNAMADDARPIDPTCACMVCRTYSRAYIHCLVTKDAMGSQLLSYHNLYYMMKLSRDLHTSIIEGRFPEFVCNFLRIMVYFFTSFTQIGPFSVYILYLLIGGIFPILCHCFEDTISPSILLLWEKKVPVELKLSSVVALFPKGDVPEWVCNAMEVAGIDISSCCSPFSSSQD
uniref:Queuine tRNA-ribosyltransferase catalytic subunit 1 n=1 Tax=Quercus lobata TaxID=97700 RepID=A0A7N2KRE1_QUELO